MKHWHRCYRWEREGLPCPFSGMVEHGEDERETEEEEKVPKGTAVRAKLPGRALQGNRYEQKRTGLLAGAADVPSIEDMVKEVLREIPEEGPDPEPFGPPPERTRPHDPVPARMGKRGYVKSPQPRRVPTRGRVPVRVPVQATVAARRAVP